MKFLIYIIFAIHSMPSRAQFSFIAIEDSIVFSESNCKIFHLDNLKESALTEYNDCFNYRLYNQSTLNLDSISIIIHNDNVKSRCLMLQKMNKSELKQKSSYDSYAFQVYLVLNKDLVKCYLVVVLLKSKFPDWNKKPICISNGLNNYSNWGLIIR